MLIRGGRRPGPGPPRNADFSLRFFWSAENVGPGCDHCADWADEGLIEVMGLVPAVYRVTKLGRGVCDEAAGGSVAEGGSQEAIG